MYTLRLLGSPGLAGPDGPVTGRVTQERKLALLAVLALAEGRSLTRDSLATIFWPEAEPARARHNVADGLWVIRSALGDEALVTRGNQVSLSTRVVATDVEAFEEALQAEELEEAAGAYAGPFMEGFHISGAPDFERWLDGKRAHLADAYTGALERLVQKAREEGDPVQAVTWARRLVSADPLNTRRALLLMEALAASGDVAGALRHGEVHGALLSEELGLPAPPEVEARIRELRASPPPVASSVRLAEPAGGSSPPARPTLGSSGSPSGAPASGSPDSPGVPSAGPAAPAPPAPPARPTAPSPAPATHAAPSSHTPPPRARRLRYASLAAGVGLAGMAAAWFIPGVTSGDAPETVPDRIVVVSFENRTGDPELDLVGRMAADALVRGLAGAGVGGVILPEDMLGTGIGIGGGPAGPARARVLAAEAGAGIAVSGTVDRHPQGAALEARITTFPGARVAAALDPVPFDPADPDEALRQIASRVMGTVAAHLGGAFPEHPFVVPTPSYEAYRTADRGTQMFLLQRMDSAAVLFRRAYEMDRKAVGYLLWEAVALWNIRDGPRVQAILDEVRPLRDQLSPFDAAHFDWLEARLQGDLPGAVRASRAARRLHPHSGLGGFQLGLDLLRLGRLDEALEAFLRLDPDRGWLAGFRFYWYDLALVYHLMGRHEDELEVAEEGYRRFPGADLRDARIRALAALGRVDEVQSAIRESPDPARPLVTATWALRRHGVRWAAVDVAEEGLRSLAAAPVPLWTSLEARLARMNAQAQLLVSAGRLEEAREAFLELIRIRSDDPELLAWVGVVEARLGLEEEARGRIDSLEVLGLEPFSRGRATMARAAIHAELEDAPTLVRSLLERSHREGRSVTRFHFNPLFDPVRDHPDVRGFFELPR